MGNHHDNQCVNVRITTVHRTVIRTAESRNKYFLYTKLY